MVTREPSRKEATAGHSITRSARIRTDLGMAMPRVFAVFMFTTKTKRLGLSIGRLLGLAPSKIFPTITPPCRYSSIRSVPYAMRPPYGNGMMTGRRCLAARSTSCLRWY